MTTLTVNDTAPPLTGTLNASISAATLAIHIKRPDGTLINRAGTVVDGALGTWTMNLGGTDLTLAGTYLVEVQVTYAGGAIQTFAHDDRGRPVTFTVRGELA